MRWELTYQELGVRLSYIKGSSNMEDEPSRANLVQVSIDKVKKYLRKDSEVKEWSEELIPDA
jgi:hypothetical protein